MSHTIIETGELIEVLPRTAYYQWLMNVTYPQIAIKAIIRGTLDGAWEEAIAEQLFMDVYNDQNEQAFDLLDKTGDKSYTKDTFRKAAYLVTQSKIIPT